MLDRRLAGHRRALMPTKRSARKMRPRIFLHLAALFQYFSRLYASNSGCGIPAAVESDVSCCLDVPNDRIRDGLPLACPVSTTTKFTGAR